MLFFQSGATTVHPHARGEQVGHRVVDAGACGSSPRTWGTVDDIDIPGLDDRFIPTHVGNR